MQKLAQSLNLGLTPVLKAWALLEAEKHADSVQTHKTAPSLLASRTAAAA
jgi:hypothetical protein